MKTEAYRCERCGVRPGDGALTAYCDACTTPAQREFDLMRRILADEFARICEQRGDRAAAQRIRAFAARHYQEE